VIRALVFDVFGTLVDWRSSIARAFAAAGVDGDPSDLADDWRGRYAPALEESNRGQRPAGTLDELHGATLDELLAARDLPPSTRPRRRSSSAAGTSSIRGPTSARASSCCGATA
jgi:2-haloacid dehalogenase